MSLSFEARLFRGEEATVPDIQCGGELKE